MKPPGTVQLTTDRNKGSSWSAGKAARADGKIIDVWSETNRDMGRDWCSPSVAVLLARSERSMSAGCNLRPALDWSMAAVGAEMSSSSIALASGSSAQSCPPMILSQTSTHHPQPFSLFASLLHRWKANIDTSRGNMNKTSDMYDDCSLH